MNIVQLIQQSIIEGVKTLYGADIAASDVTLSTTRKEFTGDYTVVTFAFTRYVKKKPEDIGQELGQFVVDHNPFVDGFNVIKGFLNLEVNVQYWLTFLQEAYENDQFGLHPRNGQKVMVEFCSPNTNKPLHLGHIRNILLGWSVHKILEAAGYDTVRVQIINDRGIAICKSMLAWQKYGEGATPESAGMKGDKFVGYYYVLFDKKLQAEYQDWQASAEGQAVFAEKKKAEQDEAAFFKGFKDLYFNDHSALGAEAREMLLRWEANDPETVELWKRMNSWVYSGFGGTFEKLGVEFDKLYYESDTYLLGRSIVEQGLEKGVFYRLEDGSVWIDIEDVKMDKKLVLRKDGTSVYITQDLGTAQLRNQDFGMDKMVYVVGDEQIYHFQVLFEILKRLGEPYANGLYHLAYGMVDLPTGKMKSREGTVVDADDLIAEVVNEALLNSQERGTLSDQTPEEQQEIIRQIGIAALKFFIVKVHPKKRMTFDPKESVDMQGQTGPYIQNAYVRIQSILRKVESNNLALISDYTTIDVVEKDLMAELHQFPEVILQAAAEYDPSLVANYCFSLAKSFHRFYHDFSILRAESESAKAFRLQLSKVIGQVLKTGMDLLGIEMPERM
jgi:arginyl-tRNA synthetase